LGIVVVFAGRSPGESPRIIIPGGHMPLRKVFCNDAKACPVHDFKRGECQPINGVLLAKAGEPSTAFVGD
jgi:hypothetical protein